MGAGGGGGLGGRLEHNDYTGYVFQPNLRLLWTPEANTSAWMSLARAVRTPSRIERGGAAYIQADPVGPPPSIVQLVSNTPGDEQVDALDLGWRRQINPSTSLDLAAFYYRYDRLRGAAAQAPVVVLPGYVLVQTVDNNANTADVHGLEASLDWRPTRDWRLQAHYAWLRARVHTAALAGQATSDYADVSPSHLLSLRSSLDLGPRLRWDAWLRHASPIRNPNFSIPAHTTLDMRLAWQAGPGLEVALVGQNLLDSAHPEYGSSFIQSTPSEIQRSFYVNLDWKF